MNKIILFINKSGKIEINMFAIKSLRVILL